MSGTDGTPEIDLGSFNTINIEGTNAGATMIIRHGTSGEHEGCCCINIYTNSNVQGCNSSVLVGSNIKMKNPGVHIYLGDLKFGGGGCSKPRSFSRRRTGGGATVDFSSVFLFVFVPVILSLLLSHVLL
ncbi:hypothetical protein Goari_020741 [Gossypium aridum]|uniref:Uncharacterized protein n=1 Tax=Gossypium aridum TaxID=34290 RepID=A0A7J8YRQ7_GOSAI|nr:hypothetical protein [Gossypium aridum]